MDTPHSKFTLLKKLTSCRKKAALQRGLYTLQCSAFPLLSSLSNHQIRLEEENIQFDTKKLKHIPNKMAELGIHNISKDSGNKIHYM